MLKSSAPTQLTVAFASGAGAGPMNAIPIPASSTSGATSWTTGFTSVNMEPIASGGIAPFGADFNGIFNALSNAQIWEQAGYLYPYSSAFATAIGGYPAGASLQMASGLGLWINQADNNSTNPDSTSSANWIELLANAGGTSIALSGASVTPTENQLGVQLLVLTGALSAACKLVLPLREGASWKILNNTTGGQTVTVGGTTGTAITIAAGATGAQEVFSDGTNYYTTSFNGSGVYLPIAGTAVAATKLATARTIAMTGDVSWTSPAFDGTANVTAAGTIAAGAVTLAKMANFQANSLLGNPTSSVATPAAITLGSGLQFSSSQLQLAPSSAQVIGWLGYTPVNKAGDTMSGNLIVGTGAAQMQVSVNGSNTGTNGGSFIQAQLNGTGCVAIGNKSAVLGGAYSSQPVLYYSGTLGFLAGSTQVASLDASGNFAANGSVTAASASISGAASANSLTSATSVTAASASVSGTASIGTLTVTGSGTVAGTLGVTGSITSGNGAGNVNIVANGLNSGTAGGAFLIARLNGAACIAMGNLSAMNGGSYNATPGIYYAGGSLTFEYGTTTTATLDSSGNLVITGGLTASGELSATGTGAAMGALSSNSTSDTHLGLTNTSTSGRSWDVGTAGSAPPTGLTVGDFFIWDSTGGSWRQRIDSSGNAYFAAALTATGAITASSYNTSSDETLKGGIQRNVAPRDLTTVPMASWESLRGLPVMGRGLIAQDLQREFSEYVGVAPDRTLGVDYGRAALEQAWFNRGRLRAIEAYLGLEV